MVGVVGSSPIVPTKFEERVAKATLFLWVACHGGDVLKVSRILISSAPVRPCRPFGLCQSAAGFPGESLYWLIPTHVAFGRGHH